MHLLFELIQVTLGNRCCLSSIPSKEEWWGIYKEAERQAIVGVLQKGLERLPEEQMPPKPLLLQWIGVAQVTQTRNLQLDRQTAIVWKFLQKNGLAAVVLKGQGVACEYGDLASLRQSGDIDIWVKGGYKAVCDFVQRTYPTDDLAYHRFHYPVFEDTEVELHHRPTLMRDLIDDKKLAKWYNSFDENSFIYLNDKGFAVPSAEFNRVFLLTHIYRHFLFEGVGLRQVMDLYFVLNNSNGNDREVELLKEFRLLRFAQAMMWLLHQQLGLNEDKLMSCGMDENEGRFLLSEILQTGNFGHSDLRYKFKRLFKLRHHIAHGSHLLVHYPSEVLWTPIWLVYHRIWKRNKKRALKDNDLRINKSQ